MRNASLWRALLGVEKTVVEDVEFDEDAQRAGRRMCGPRAAADAVGAVGVSVGAPWYDRGRGAAAVAGAGSGHGPGRSSRPTRRGCAAPSTGRRCVRCRGPGTAPVTPAPSMTGGLAGHAVLEDRGDRADADRVAHGRGDHRPGLGRHRRRASTGSPGCAGSGSTRSPTSAGTKYLTVVVDHDSGRLVWAAPGRDTSHPATVLRRSSAPQRCAQITHVSADAADWIATWSPSAARTRCAAPTRSTSSPGPPKPSTRCAAKPGTTPAASRRTAGQTRAGDHVGAAPARPAARTLPATR